MRLLIALSCLAAAPFQMTDFAVPEAIEQVDVPETMQALGVPVRIRAVRSKLKPEALIDYFEDAFSNAGLFVPEEGELHSAGNLVQVTGYDVVKRRSISVLLQPNLDGTTTVLVGEANLAGAKKGAPAAFAPVFPAAIGLLVADLEIGQSLSYSARARPEEVTGFYRETMLAEGYKEVGASQYERKGVLVRLWLKPREAGTVGVVVVRSAAR